MKKSGFVLISVLIFISFAFIIIVNLFDENKKSVSFEKIAKSEVQKAIILKDIKPILDKFIKEENMNFSYSFKAGEFDIDIEIDSNQKGIDIKNILKNGFLERICEKYLIVDCQYLKDLIADTLDKDSVQRAFESELAEDYMKIEDGKIEKIAFSKILKRYAKNSGDLNVYAVPWNKILSFHHCNECDFLDCRYKVGLLEELKSECKDFKEAKSYEIVCKVAVKYQDFANRFRLYYNIKNKKVLKIE